MNSTALNTLSEQYYLGVFRFPAMMTESRVNGGQRRLMLREGDTHWLDLLDVPDASSRWPRRSRSAIRVGVVAPSRSSVQGQVLWLRSRSVPLVE